MKIPIYQVDAFTSNLFGGNPAAICPLKEWLPDETMQKIAEENNLAETAFFVKKDTRYEIRWFTPAVEVDLRGHATLASAKVLFDFENHSEDEIEFYSPRSGVLKVTRTGTLLTLDFPSDKIEATELTEEMAACLDIKPEEAFKGKTDLMFVFNHEEQIKNIKPDFLAMMKLKVRGIIVTAKGNHSDFVSRFFAPQSGINEDPVTGSAHTTLTPYWAKKTGKSELKAIQLSARKGFLECAYRGDRVKISGKGVTYLQGEITIE